MAAVAAQDDRRGPAPVDDEDRLVAGRASSAASAATSRPESRPRLPARELLAQVDDLDDGPARRSAASAGRPGGSAPSRARPTLSTAGVALPRTTAAPASSAEPDRGVAGLDPRRPVALVGAPRAPRRRRSGRRRASGARTASRVPTTMSTSPARIRRHSSARSPSPKPGVDEGDPDGEVRPEAVDERHRERDLRDEDEGRPAALERRRRSPRRRSRSCRRR